MKLFQDFLLFLDEKTKHEKNYTQPRTGQKNMATTNSSKNNAQTYDHTAANWANAPNKRWPKPAKATQKNLKHAHVSDVEK